MKKIKIFLIVAVLFCGIKNVNAACDATETNRLNNLANKIKTSWDIIIKEEKPGENYGIPDGLTEEEIKNYVIELKYFKIYIHNITEDLYVRVTNKKTNEAKEFYYQDTDNGTATFEVLVTDKIVNYDVVVYASNKTECLGTELKKTSFATPMYNHYSEYEICNGIEEYYLCHEYLNMDTSFDNFWDSARQYRDNKEKEEIKRQEEEKKNKGLIGYIKEHKGTVIITSILVIGIGGIVTVIIVKKQRSRII